MQTECAEAQLKKGESAAGREELINSLMKAFNVLS